MGTFKNKTERVEFAIALLVIAFCGFAIYSFSFPEKLRSDAETVAPSTVFEKSQAVDSLLIGETHYYSVSRRALENERIEAPQPIAPVAFAPVVSTTASIGIDTATEEVFSTPTATQPTTEENELETVPQNKKPIEKRVAAQPVDTIESVTIPTAEKIQQNVDVKTTDNDFSKECVILIGAFGDKKNIRLLRNELEKDGYNIFTTPFKGLTRIGIYQPCNAKVLENKLVEIRWKYAPDAMVLEKK